MSAGRRGGRVGRRDVAVCADRLRDGGGLALPRCELLGPARDTLPRVQQGMQQVWSRSPVALRAYLVLNLLWPVADAVAGVGYLYVHLGFIVINAVIFYFMLKGVRWLWWLSVVGGALGLLSVATGGTAWYFGVGYVVALALLLLPETRQYFFGREAVATAA
jgi:hypothetical protein